MKCFCVFLSLLMLIGLVSCNDVENANQNTVTELDITAFAAWLDSEGFVPAMSQSKMLQKMDSYTYNDVSVKKATVGYFYDGQYGGGYSSNGENFGFHNNYTASQNGETADYSNSFYTQVPLDGLTLPFEIEFGDTLRDALTKMGISQKLPSDFTPDKGEDSAMTLYSDERYTLVFNNLNLSKEPIETDAPYELIFTENYIFTRGNGKESNVTRTIKLTFTADQNELHEFHLQISENYPLK